MTHYGPIEKLREAAEGEAYLVLSGSTVLALLDRLERAEATVARVEKLHARALDIDQPPAGDSLRYRYGWADGRGLLVDDMKAALDGDGDRTLHPDAQLPASWHRAAMGRVAREVHGVRLHYPTQEDD